MLAVSRPPDVNQALLIVKTIIAFIIMGIVGRNLIGFVVRGLLWSAPDIDTQEDTAIESILAEQVRRAVVVNVVMTVFFCVLTGAYLFSLYFFWNVALAIAGVLAMVRRLPDLLWEIRTGVKVCKYDRPTGAFCTIATFMGWPVLALVWYALRTSSV